MLKRKNSAGTVHNLLYCINSTVVLTVPGTVILECSSTLHTNDDGTILLYIHTGRELRDS